jgi:hypothetical protein
MVYRNTKNSKTEYDDPLEEPYTPPIDTGYDAGGNVGGSATGYVGYRGGGLQVQDELEDDYLNNS